MAASALDNGYLNAKSVGGSGGEYRVGGARVGLAFWSHHDRRHFQDGAALTPESRLPSPAAGSERLRSLVAVA